MKGKNSMGSLIIGILFIIGGASGHFVLRGSNSSSGLAILGVGLCIWGIIQLARPKPLPSESDADDTAVQNIEEEDFEGDSRTPQELYEQGIDLIGKYQNDAGRKLIKRAEKLGYAEAKTYLERNKV